MQYNANNKILSSGVRFIRNIENKLNCQVWCKYVIPITQVAVSLYSGILVSSFMSGFFCIAIRQCTSLGRAGNFAIWESLARGVT